MFVFLNPQVKGTRKFSLWTPLQNFEIMIKSQGYLDRSKFLLWTPPQNFHQITLTLYLFMLFHCILCGVLVLEGSDSAFVCMCGTLERADLMEHHPFFIKVRRENAIRLEETEEKMRFD